MVKRKRVISEKEAYEHLLPTDEKINIEFIFSHELPKILKENMNIKPHIFTLKDQKTREDFDFIIQVRLLYHMLPKSIQKVIDKESQPYKIHSVDYEKIYNIILEKLEKFGKHRNGGT